MKKILILASLSVLLASCAFSTKTGTAAFDPDADTVRAVGELVRIVLSDK